MLGGGAAEALVPPLGPVGPHLVAQLFDAHLERVVGIAPHRGETGKAARPQPLLQAAQVPGQGRVQGALHQGPVALEHRGQGRGQLSVPGGEVAHLLQLGEGEGEHLRRAREEGPAPDALPRRLVPVVEGQGAVEPVLGVGQGLEKVVQL